MKSVNDSQITHYLSFCAAKNYNSVSIQAQILDLIKQLCRQRSLGVIIVTHDIGVIANIADRVAVMYRGEVVETGDVAQILGAPQHKYTKSLIAAVPRADQKFKILVKKETPPVCEIEKS